MDFEHDEHAEGHAADDGSHATVGFYSFIAIVLCLVTGVEVLLLYPPLNAMPDFVRIILLVGLSIAKFATVVAFFMHLYFDHPLTTGLFLMGLILAAGTMVGLIHVVPGPHEPHLLPTPKPAVGEEEPVKEHSSFQRLDGWRVRLNA